MHCPFCVLVLLAPSVVTAAEEEPVVQTKQGPVKGFTVTTYREQETLVFLGIPYAKPPVGDLRFKPPRPPDPWNGTFEAFEEGNECPQAIQGSMRGTEDCLFLNVYTKKLPVEGCDPTAVMVWIHGGSYTGGSGSASVYGPDHLLTEDVVVVTINYRLGLLGFLHLPEAGLAGNNGLKDQTMALRWVRDNIANFGGDPKRVTIFGQSAGAASVHFHMLSPMSRGTSRNHPSCSDRIDPGTWILLLICPDGTSHHVRHLQRRDLMEKSQGLFQGAIAQSGTVVNMWAYGKSESVRNSAIVHGEDLKCNASSDQELLRCFQKASLEELVFVKNTYFMPFRPTVDEGGIDDEEVFLPADPHAMLSAGNFSDVPAIFGSTSGELNAFVEIAAMMNPNASLQETAMNDVPEFLAAIYPKAQAKTIVKKAWDLYVGNMSDSKNNNNNIVDMLTDLAFAAGIVRSLSLQAAAGKSPIFQYLFGFEGALNLVKVGMGINESGASHGDDIGYQFHSMFSQPVDNDSPEMTTVMRMVRMWANFAKTWDPSGDVKWQPFTVENPMYLYIGEHLSMRRDLLGERKSFWFDNMWPQ
ncbi:esterase E4-like isoform X2 [Periplaneta americana]|uniref:esterase E4-like isoform X2 n=1 Tax=Periplaneta americana TaxID=6978 RepID=UPI0037E849F6